MTSACKKKKTQVSFFLLLSLSFSLSLLSFVREKRLGISSSSHTEVMVGVRKPWSTIDVKRRLQ